MTITSILPVEVRAGNGVGDWAERHAGRIMVLPAVLIVLAFAVFPLIISAYLSVTRFALAPGAFGPLAWGVAALTAAALLYWLYRYATSGKLRPMGLVGRLITAGLSFGVVLLILATIVSRGFPGSLMTTLVYVFAGVANPFVRACIQRVFDAVGPIEGGLLLAGS